MKKILTHSTCFTSAMRLRDELAQLTGEKILVTGNPNRIKKRQLLVRYGNSDRVNGIDTGYNSAAFVMASSNKIRFSRMMAQAGITSPQFYKNQVPQQFPVLIRTMIQGNAGRGIYIAENRQEFNDLWSRRFWWTPWFNTEFEIRAHVFLPNGGGVIIPRIFRKVGEDGKRPIRTNDRYRFQLKNVDRYKKAIESIHQISGMLRDMGGKFFALDMGYSKERGEYIIFESNSGPGINENTAREYAQFMLNDGLRIK